MTEICQKCLEHGDDRRTLWMACFYDMSELNIPFEEQMIIEGGINDSHPNQKHHFYTLRVCKDCRADWLHAIKDWWDRPAQLEEPCGSGIFVRDFGANVEITREEWDKRNERT